VKSRGIKITPEVQCGTPGEALAAGRKARRKSRDARHGRTARRGSRGESIPRRMSSPPGVSGGKRRRRGERDARRCRPTLHRRAH
jgi:hypothetical protein